jgi:hypothetical protein
VNAHLVLAVIAALALWVGWLYVALFGRCGKCGGTGTIKRTREGKHGRQLVRVKVCPGAKAGAVSSAAAPAPSTGSRSRSATGTAQLPGTSRRTVMGHPDGAHTHGSGGGGLGSALLVVLGAALVVKAAPPLPQERRAGELPRESQNELPGERHLHFHGISAEDVAAIIAREDLPRPEANPPGPPHVP